MVLFNKKSNLIVRSGCKMHKSEVMEFKHENLMQNMFLGYKNVTAWS